MNDTKYTPVLVSYSLRNSKQPGFCQNSQVPRPLRITRLSEPFVGFPNNVRRRPLVEDSGCSSGRATPHSGSKRLKPAKNKFTPIDFTSFSMQATANSVTFRFRKLHAHQIKKLSNCCGASFAGMIAIVSLIAYG